jgi:simple sugar transport system ATP-binding protein
MSTLLVMKGITKTYPNGTVANCNVDLSLEEGEIHAIAGENGAGKSTIMKILYGMERADAGEIYLRGERVAIRSPRDAMALGIGMVHQHFMLINELSVYENIFLGRELTKWGLLKRSEMIDQARSLGARYGIRIDPLIPCGNLSVSLAQKVEILKALAQGARLLILDEPTAVLTPQETEELFSQLRLLRASGVTIVIITHKLREIKALCDRVTVLRNGLFMGTHSVGALTEEDISRLMIGRDANLAPDKSAPRPGGEVLRVEKLSVRGPGCKNALEGVNFSVRAGEILCLAGVEGNGQQQTIACVTGLNRAYTGTIRLCGTDIRGKRVNEIRGLGLSHIPEDRLARGANAKASITDNLIALDYKQNNVLGLIPYRAREKQAREQLASYAVRAGSVRQKIGMLSGGNMQKIVVAREIGASPKLLVADQPTRGVDIGAIEIIRKRMIELRDSGCAILLCSADLSEVLALSDRIVVFREGRVAAHIEDVRNLSEEQLGRYMLGLDDMGKGGHGFASENA